MTEIREGGRARPTNFCKNEEYSSECIAQPMSSHYDTDQQTENLTGWLVSSATSSVYQLATLLVRRLRAYKKKKKRWTTRVGTTTVVFSVNNTTAGGLVWVFGKVEMSMLAGAARHDTANYLAARPAEHAYGIFFMF